MFRVIDRDRTFHGEFETRDQADETLANLFENAVRYAGDAATALDHPARDQRNIVQRAQQIWIKCQ